MNGASVAAAGAAAYAAKVNAIKAGGPVVFLEPNDFIRLLSEADDAFVVVARGGWLNRKLKYLFGYRGLFFTTASKEKLALPGRADVIWAHRLWVPDM